MDNPVIAEPEGEPIPPVRMEQGASVYDCFAVTDRDRRDVSQVEALLADPGVAGYIRGEAGGDWQRGRLGHGLLGFFVTAVCLAAFAYAVPGNIWRPYYPRPRPPRDHQLPRSYTDIARLPPAFRDTVADINNDIASGARWQTAFAKLRAFIDGMGAANVDMSDAARVWACQEMLVVLASKEIPPGDYPGDYPDSLYRKLDNLLVVSGSPMPFRAGAAYARLLGALPEPKDGALADAARERLIDVLERVREDNPTEADNDRAFLTLEAEQHIRAFPPDYGGDTRPLDYHWRRSAHAIFRLYELFGRSDPETRALDRKRWQIVYGYFDIAFLTLDTGRLLRRLPSVRLDGVDYTREQVRRELENL